MLNLMSEIIYVKLSHHLEFKLAAHDNIICKKSTNTNKKNRWNKNNVTDSFRL